jgi:hypothetical protein
MGHILADPGIRLKLLMLGVLLFVLYKPIKSIILGLRARGWRKIKATVTASGLDRESGVYYPKIIYNYTVNGREFTDDNYTFCGAITNSKAHALAAVRANPVGKEIVVFVNPEEPARTVVVPGVHWSAYANVAFFVLIFGSIAFLVEILNFIWPGCQPNCT